MKKVLLFLANGFEEYKASVFTDVLGWSRSFGDIPVEVITTGRRPKLKCTMINYNLAAKTYDNTRKSSNNTIKLMNEKIKFNNLTYVLDFGCGTGNYLNEIQKIFSSKCFGVEP